MVKFVWKTALNQLLTLMGEFVSIIALSGKYYWKINVFPNVPKVTIYLKKFVLRPVIIISMIQYSALKNVLKGSQVQKGKYVRPCKGIFLFKF